jgi:cell shape-determining protein MreC
MTECSNVLVIQSFGHSFVIRHSNFVIAQRRWLPRMGTPDVSRLHFNQVFFGLMSLALLSAFVAPPRISDVSRIQIEGLFIPISRPAYHLANWVRGRLVREAPADARPDQAIIDENLALKQQVSRLQMQIEHLSALAGERKQLGKFEDLCDRYTVNSADSGNRGSLALGGILTGLHKEQPVLYSAGLVGWIDSAGVAGARVRLITDAGFTVTGRFVRFLGADGSIKEVQVSDFVPIVAGTGLGDMVIGNLPYDDVSKTLHVNDWVVLADEVWPSAVQGMHLGRIVSIGRLERQPLFAEIHVVPASDLTRLRDVWVLMRSP